MFQLKQYQQKAVDGLLTDTYSLMKRNIRRSKLLLKAPTGAGKTITLAAYLNQLALDLPSRFDVPVKRVAFIWLAPNQLHIQSYTKIREYFSEIRTIRPINFEDIIDGKLQPNECLFLNWQSVSSDKNLFVKNNERNRNLFYYAEDTQDYGTEIITILDEAHLFASKGDKAIKVLEKLDSLIEIDVSATPYFKSEYSYTIKRDAVVEEQMIKKGVHLNPALNADMQQGDKLNIYLLKQALQKRNELAERYKQLNININPLLLIQLPSDTPKETALDNQIKQTVIVHLRELENIHTDNMRLAIWLSTEVKNKEYLEKYDSTVEVLLFKQAISFGWDCPRAAVLLIFREMQQEVFTIQTVGRILRMPQLKHYPDEALNFGYVYTNLSRNIIKIVADDMNYIVENRADRKPAYESIALQSSHINTSIIRNRLGSKFRTIFYKVAEEYFGISRQLDDTPVFERNKEKLKQKFVETDVKRIEITIPKDILIEAGYESVTQINSENQLRLAKTTGELMILFAKFCWENCGGYAPKESHEVMIDTFYNFFQYYIGTNTYEMYPIILYPPNQPHFIQIIQLSIAGFTKYQEEKARQSKKEIENYQWEVPEFRIYNEKYARFDAEKHILDPTFLIQKSQTYLGDSRTEYDFIQYLETNKEHIQWWYKNGVGNRADFAIEYQTNNNIVSLFYVDFIIKFNSGKIGLFDTKTPESDPEMQNKHNALIDYIARENARGKKLCGGIVLNFNKIWKYTDTKISDKPEYEIWNLFNPAEM